MMIALSKRIRKIERIDSILFGKRITKRNRMKSEQIEWKITWMIYELIQQTGYVTTADILKYVNKSSPNITKLFKKLDENDYLMHEKYRGLKLCG